MPSWFVETESGSIHLLEDRLDGSQWITRVSDPGRPGWSARLRRDGEAIRVIGGESPVVGKPWYLLLDLRGDGILTHRFTTPVVDIRPANLGQVEDG